MDQKPMEKISLMPLINVIVRKRILIMIGLLAGLLMGAFVEGLTMVHSRMNPLALLSSSFAVTAQNEDGLFSSYNTMMIYDGPNSTDYYLAERMAHAVIYVASSDSVLNSVISQLNLIGTDSSELREHLTMSEYEDTQIIEIRFTWGSVAEGQKILEKITDILPDILVNTLKLGNVSIVNPPKAIGTTAKGFSKKIVILFGLVGVLGIMGWSVLEYLLYPTILEAENMRERLGLKVLGNIPWAKQGKQVKMLSPGAKEHIPKYFKEAIAYTARYLPHVVGDEKCLIVTSSMSREGKSVISAFVAESLAERGKRTLLVDLNTRQPVLGSMYALETDEQKTVNAVAAGASVQDAVISVSPCLDVLPCAREDIPLVVDQQLCEKLREAAEGYDLVLFDTVAAGAYSDTLMLSAITKKMLLVVQQDHTPQRRIMEVIQSLRLCQFDIVGGVFHEKGYAGRKFSIGAMIYDIPGMSRLRR